MFDHTHLIGQFVVSAAENRAPQGWVSDSVGGWFLGRHPALPAIRLMGGEDCAVGWMLGYPISEEGRLLSDGAMLRVPAQALVSAEALEAFIYAFGGRFAVVFLDARHPRFYLDPCGSLSAVYCAHQKMVASTPNLIPYDDHTRDRVELARAIGIPQTSGMYPLGLTPRLGVERILPNHFLDLSDWRTVRHWPQEPLAEVASIEEGIAEITTIVKRQIAAVVATTPTYLKLTAGKDSRVLLACARGLAHRLELVTAQIGDESSAIDCSTARRIAKRFGLKHRVLPMEKATEADLQEWMFRIGHSTGEVRGWRSATTFKRLPGGHAVLGGNGAELGTNSWWRRQLANTAVITPEQLLHLCQCPPLEEPLARVRSWLASVPAVNPTQIADLFMLEQRLGCWAGVWAYAECDAGFAIFPVSHRRVIARMFTLPDTYRRSPDLLMPRDIIRREWPELLRWPINEPVGTSHLLIRAKRKITKGALALRNPEHLRDWLRRVVLGPVP